MSRGDAEASFELDADALSSGLDAIAAQFATMAGFNAAETGGQARMALS
jgi:hypothetical protein